MVDPVYLWQLDEETTIDGEKRAIVATDGIEQAKQAKYDTVKTFVNTSIESVQSESLSGDSMTVIVSIDNFYGAFSGPIVPAGMSVGCEITKADGTIFVILQISQTHPEVVSLEVKTFGTDPYNYETFTYKKPNLSTQDKTTGLSLLDDTLLTTNIKTKTNNVITHSDLSGIFIDRIGREESVDEITGTNDILAIKYSAYRCLASNSFKPFLKIILPFQDSLTYVLPAVSWDSPAVFPLNDLSSTDPTYEQYIGNDIRRVGDAFYFYSPGIYKFSCNIGFRAPAGGSTFFAYLICGDTTTPMTDQNRMIGTIGKFYYRPTIDYNKFNNSFDIIVDESLVGVPYTILYYCAPAEPYIYIDWTRLSSGNTTVSSNYFMIEKL